MTVSQTSARSQYDAAFIWPFQIDARIFEPQGISMLDAEASFITNDLLESALTKSFSGKKVMSIPLGLGVGVGGGAVWALGLDFADLSMAGVVGL